MLTVMPLVGVRSRGYSVHMNRSLAIGCLSLSLLACIPDPGNTDGGGGACPAATGSGTTHATWPTASETWAATGNPHLVTTGLKIAAGVKLTIEPCAEVRLSSGAYLQIDGELVAEGTATRPITFVQAQSGQPFGSLSVWAPGRASLAYASLTGGGSDTTNAWGAIEARGDQPICEDARGLL